MYLTLAKMRHLDAMDIYGCYGCYGSVPLGCQSRRTRWTPRQRKQQRSRWPMSTQATGENRDLPRVPYWA